MSSQGRHSKGLLRDLLLVFAALLLLTAIVFGGASRVHALRLALVELASLPLLVVAVTELVRQNRWTDHRFALGLAAAIVAIPIIQLIPLPPAIWTAIPGRQELTLALNVAGVQPAWGTISLTPDRTLRAALALLPPVSMFLAMLAGGNRIGPRLITVALGVAIISMLLGALQLASGSERFYPWETTSAGAVAGFFSNGNHLATLLLILLPFALVIGAAVLRRRGAGHLPLWLSALVAGLVVITLAAIRSRAGIILFVPIIFLGLAAAWIAAGQKSAKPRLLLLVGVLAVALTGVVSFAAPRILSRFAESSGEGRFDRWPTVAEAAQEYLPLGSGMGSFDPIYRSKEPLNLLDSTFFNQAHNDYLEIWLETGWLGPAVLVAFLIWLTRRGWSAWRAGPSKTADLQRAASVGIIAVLLHSSVDYPLRTVAIATVLALLCGLLEMSRLEVERPLGGSRTRGAGRSTAH